MICFFFSFSLLDMFVHIRYNALVVCLLPITFDERSKDDLSFSATNSSRERAIECLKRAKIDNYKVS